MLCYFNKWSYPQIYCFQIQLFVTDFWQKSRGIWVKALPTVATRQQSSSSLWWPGLKFTKTSWWLIGNWPLTVLSRFVSPRCNKEQPHGCHFSHSTAQLSAPADVCEWRSSAVWHAATAGHEPWSRIAAPALFGKVRVDYGTVVWPGEIDIAPETLLLDSVPAPGVLAA